MAQNEKSFLMESFGEVFLPERERLWERHRKGAGGLEIVQAHARLVDHLLGLIYERLASSFGGKAITHRIALVGLGGYGRGELNPHSDIDIMFLVDGPVGGQQPSFISEFITLLWDMKFHVGHSCRQLRDCNELVRQDVMTATAMLEGRFLLGHRPIFEKFKKQVQEDYARRHRVEFVQRKIASIEERHHAHDNSQFHLEPNVKEGVGSLRDVHSALWIERVAHGIDSLDDLPPSNLVDEYDLVALKASYDFLLRVRTELHLRAGRKQDLLDMSHQEQVAESFGFRHSPKKSATEKFMSYFYLNVGHIRHFLNVIVERERRNPEIFTAPKPRKCPDLIPEPFVLIGDSIFLEEDRNRYFAGEAGVRTLMRIFQSVQQHDLSLSDHLLRCIRRSIPLVRLQLLYLEEIHQHFWNLLRTPGPVARTLRLMHETGLLAAILPEFEGVTCLYQYDYYHQFTVDEHTFRVLEETENFLRAGAEDPEMRLLRETTEQITRPEILRLAILLHDAGKAEGRVEHIRNGIMLAERVCQRLEADPEVSRSVKFLIENHLLMSRMAHRRDLSDPQVIAHFTEIVGSPDMLRMLFVLTCADIRGVSRGSWTGWKAALLEELFLRSLEALQSGGPASRSPRPNMRELLLSFLPPGTDPAKVDAHLQNLPENYLQEGDPEEIAEHLALIEGLASKPFNTQMKRRTSFTEFTICTGDRPGLFADITGTLAGAGADVRSARVFTREDGIALDIFLLMDREGNPLPLETLDTLNQQFADVFSGRRKVQDLIRRQETRIIPGRRPGSVLPSRVQIDNESSQAYTILDVYAHDRVGVLHEISQGISELGLDIHLAKIATDVDQVLDIFYVTDRLGNKITDPQELDKIELTLLRVLEKGKQATPPAESASF